MKTEELKGLLGMPGTNFHTHTKRCKHATGEDRDYIETAIKEGYKVLGFSDHSPWVWEDGFVSPNRMDPEQFDEYAESILSLKKEYASDIDIYLGVEMEYQPALMEKTFEVLNKQPVDYLILGNHFFDDERYFPYSGDDTGDEELLKLYVDRSIEALNTDMYLYMAHPDLICYMGPQYIYEKHMQRLLDCLKEKNMPIEININGLIHGYKYPHANFMEMGIENGNTFFTAIDAHSPEALKYKFTVTEAFNRLGVEY